MLFSVVEKLNFTLCEDLTQLLSHLTFELLDVTQQEHVRVLHLQVEFDSLEQNSLQHHHLLLLREIQIKKKQTMSKPQQIMCHRAARFLKEKTTTKNCNCYVICDIKGNYHLTLLFSFSLKNILK